MPNSIHNNRSTKVKIQHTWHTHYHGRPQKGGGENRRSLSLLIENHTFFTIWVAF